MDEFVSLPLILLIVGIVFSFYIYGRIKFFEGNRFGYYKGLFDGSQNVITLLYKMGVVDPIKLIQDLKDGKYNHIEGIESIMKEIK
jgi:hypothetical protein